MKLKNGLLHCKTLPLVYPRIKKGWRQPFFYATLWSRLRLHYDAAIDLTISLKMIAPAIMSEEKIPDKLAAPPVGELYTRVYLERGPVLEESATFRKRLGAYVQYDLNSTHWDLSVFIKKESGLGVEYSFHTSHTYTKFEDFFKTISRDELLNVITLVWRYLSFAHTNSKTVNGKLVQYSMAADKWLAFVTRVLNEENIGYVLDSACGVRHAVDTQFQLQRSSVLKCLEPKRYVGVLAAFEDAHRYFNAAPQDLKAAVRAVFESVEILVKMMVRTDRLTSSIVTGDLKALALKACGGDAVAQRAVAKAMDGFADWVDGIHNYRHGQDQPEPVAPQLDYAIYVLSSGAAFLRWLAGMDSAKP